MAWPRDLGDERDYRNGFHDGRMDALLPRAGVPAPDDASELYLVGYRAGTRSVGQAVDKAA